MLQGNWKKSAAAVDGNARGEHLEPPPWLYARLARGP